MKLKYWIASILIGVAAAGSTALGDEASGTISETGFGSFTLAEKGVSRKFNLSGAESQFEPAAWRPMAGDTINVTFEVRQGRRGATVLAVKKAVLVKAGPDTVVQLESPVTVEITEVGRTGIKGKVPKGQVVRFVNQKSMQRVPPGWMPAVGEKVIITFQVKVGRGVDRLIEKIEKAP